MELEYVVLLLIYAIPVIIFVPESEKTMESHNVSDLDEISLKTPNTEFEVTSCTESIFDGR